MRVELITKRGKLQLNGATIQINAEQNQTVMLRAEVDEGDSPVQIVMQGKQQPVSIRSLQIVDKRSRVVKQYSFMRNKKLVTVHRHYRRVPLAYKPKGG
jgi:hypothetical protein